MKYIKLKSLINEQFLREYSGAAPAPNALGYGTKSTGLFRGKQTSKPTANPTTVDQKQRAAWKDKPDLRRDVDIRQKPPSAQGYKNFTADDFEDLYENPLQNMGENQQLFDKFKDLLIERWYVLSDTIRRYGLRIPNDKKLEEVYVGYIVLELMKVYDNYPEYMAKDPDNILKEHLDKIVGESLDTINYLSNQVRNNLKQAIQKAGLPSLPNEDQDVISKIVYGLMAFGWNGKSAPITDEEMSAKMVQMIHSLRKKGQLPKSKEERKQISDQEKKAWERALYSNATLVNDVQEKKGIRTRTADLIDVLAIEMGVSASKFAGSDEITRMRLLLDAFDVLIKRGKKMEPDTKWAREMLSFSNAIKNDPKWLEKLKNVRMDDPERGEFDRDNTNFYLSTEDAEGNKIKIVPIDSWKFKPEGDSQKEILKALEKNIELANKIQTSWWNVLKPHEEFITQRAKLVAGIDAKKDKKFMDNLVHALETVFKFTLEKFQQEGQYDQKNAIQRALEYLKKNKIVTKQSADAEFKRLTGMADTTRLAAIDNIKKLVKSDKRNAQDVIRIANTANNEITEAFREFQNRHPKNKNSNEKYIRQVINHFLINPAEMHGVDMPDREKLEMWANQYLPQYVKTVYPANIGGERKSTKNDDEDYE